MTPRSCFESLIFGDLVQGFTEAHRVEGPDHVPVLRKFDSELLPKNLVAFNDRGRGQDPEDTGLHFYKRDQTFSSVVLNPLGWVDRIFDYKCVLTPDVTLSPKCLDGKESGTLFTLEPQGQFGNQGGLRSCPLFGG